MINPTYAEPHENHSDPLRKTLGMICLLATIWSSQSCLGTSMHYQDRYRLDFFRGSLAASGSFAPGGKFQMYIKVDPVDDVLGAEIEIALPEGIGLDSGENRLRADLKKNRNYLRSVMLRVIRAGEWEIHVIMKHPKIASFNRDYTLYVQSNSSGGCATSTRRPRLKTKNQDLKLER
jgi:hypothetical protein